MYICNNKQLSMFFYAQFYHILLFSSHKIAKPSLDTISLYDNIEPVFHSSSVMESLSELQNPLLDKTSRNMVPNDYQGYQCDYTGQPYQDSLIGYYYTGTNDTHKTQQFLDATSLHVAVEAFYKPNFILYKDNISLHSKDSKSESFETTFTEGKDADATEILLDSTQEEKDVKIQTVSYEVEEEQGPEYEVRKRVAQYQKN